MTVNKAGFFSNQKWIESKELQKSKQKGNRQNACE